MSNCTDCVKLDVIKKGSSGCASSARKLTDFRITCEEQIVETISASPNTACDIGYISDIVSADPALDPTPFYYVEVVEADDLDENDDFTFDRTTDIGEDTYAITITVKIYDPDQQCTFESLKGKDIVVVYKIENQDGDYVFRRFRGKVTAITGGLLAGYQITIDNLDPETVDKPLYVNFGDAATTESGLDTLTTF